MWRTEINEYEEIKGVMNYFNLVTISISIGRYEDGKYLELFKVPKRYSCIKTAMRVYDEEFEHKKWIASVDKLAYGYDMMIIAE